MERNVRSTNMRSLARISPSRYYSLTNCALKEIWSSNRRPTLLPLSPAARLGSVIHKILELVNKRKIVSEEELATTWDVIVHDVEHEMLGNNLEKHLVPLQKHAFRYEVKRRMTIALAKEVVQQRRVSVDQEEPARVESEVWLESDDRKIGGIIDLIVHQRSGIEIRDYKSGKVLEGDSDNSEPKEEYKIQLWLYAALYFEVRKVWPCKLKLVGLDGNVYDVAFDKEICHRLFEQARAKLDEINSQLKEGGSPEQFANPSPDACFFCDYRPACRKYWQTRYNDENWPLDVSGKVKKIRVLGNGTLRINLDTGNRIVSIRGLIPERHKFLNDQIEEVLFCNVGRDSAEDCFIQTPLTVGYRVWR